MPDTKIIKIFEDKQKKLELTQQNIDDILLMREIIGDNNILLQADGKLLVRHYVGFIQINKTRLLVFPKIAKTLNSEEECKKSFDILMKLLIYSEFTGIKKTPNSQSMDKYKGDLLEFFIGIFVDELLLRFKREINRGYNEYLENQTFIKGKIDFIETVKKNSFRKHLHYVRYDNFSENILLNRIFKTVIKRLIIITKSDSNKIKLKQASIWLEDVDEILLTSEVWQAVKFNRQNNKYELCFNMAKLIYSNYSPNMNEGNNNTLSFLVPVNRLFELYLFKVFDGNYKDIEVRYQGPIKYLAHNTESKCFQLHPDITFIDQGQVQYILDAKYKDVSSYSNKLNISQADIYQMLAYSVKYRCENIALLYPKIMLNDDINASSLVEELEIDNYGHIIKIKIIQADLEISPEKLADELSQMFL